jgi:cytochrome c oxidase subunit 4
MATDGGVMRAGPGTKPGTDHEVDGGHSHPTEMVYVKIAIILSIITAVEVAIFYIEALDSILVPALIIMSAVKFVVVVGYFMHLKFDDRRLAWIFLSGLAMAFAVFIVVALVMHWDKVTQFTRFQPVNMP